MKLVKKTNLAILQAQADAFNAIVEAVVQSSEGATPEDITADAIIEALQENHENDALTALQTEYDALSNQLDESATALETANNRIAELEAELADLDNTPASTGAKVNPQADSNDTMTIAQFADKNKGNTEAILEQAKKDGLI